MSSLPRIGITLGDVAGIGPEVVAKALASVKLNRRFDYEIIGDPHTKHHADAKAWIIEGARRCLRGELVALVTAPVSKRLVAPWPGQTELLAHVAHSKKFAMMLVGGPPSPRLRRTSPLRVALVTIHEPLHRVPRLLTARKIVNVIELTEIFCRRLGIKQPRIGVAGLNPHAGEGGLLGDEERRIIAPAIKRTKATGPWPACTLFPKAYCGAFYSILAMY